MTNSVRIVLALACFAQGASACGLSASSELPSEPARAEDSPTPASAERGGRVEAKVSALNPRCPGGPDGGNVALLSVGQDHQSVTFIGDCFNEGDSVGVWLLDTTTCSLFPDGVIDFMTVEAGTDASITPGFISGTFSGVCACEGTAFFWAWDFDAGIDARSAPFGFCAL